MRIDDKGCIHDVKTRLSKYLLKIDHTICAYIVIYR